MNMIIHQTICPYHNAVPFAGRLKMLQVGNTIRIREKYFKPAIAALNDVMGMKRDD
jgi:hypothetical protein